MEKSRWKKFDAGWVYVLVAGAVLASGVTARAQSSTDLGDACMNAFGSSLACGSMGPPATQLVPLYFAALAMSSSTLKAGASHGQISQEEAERVALANCRAMGATDCQVLRWAQNECLGFATSRSAPKEYGWAADDGRSAAGASALAACKTQGGLNCVLIVTPCAGDDVRFSSPLPLPAGNKPGSVDPNLVGTWALSINPGRWVWVVGPDGTYTFHSEAIDGVASNMGTFSAKNGHYTLHAVNLTWDDQGTYTFHPPGTLVATGKLGTGTWVKISGEGDD